MTRLQPSLIEIQNWPFRISKPTSDSEKQRMLLLLHGHLGNENAIWILASALPEDYLMLAPRAPIKMGPSQYSWHKVIPQWPSLQAYNTITQQLLNRVEEYSEFNHIFLQNIDVMGFSQGASVAYSLAFLHPDKIGKVAALAGFIPENWKSEIRWGAVKDKKFYLAHGTQDEIIPFQKAQKASQWLKEHGANVTFCSSNTGHKLNSNCLKGLGEFFSFD